MREKKEDDEIRRKGRDGERGCAPPLRRPTEAQAWVLRSHLLGCSLGPSPHSLALGAGNLGPPKTPVSKRN